MHKGVKLSSVSTVPQIMAPVVQFMPQGHPPSVLSPNFFNPVRQFHSLTTDTNDTYTPSQPAKIEPLMQEVLSQPPSTHQANDENRKLIRVGSRVVRGRDWGVWNEADGGGEGTVTHIDRSLFGDHVHVEWRNGNNGKYAVGLRIFQVKLAHHS